MLKMPRTVNNNGTSTGSSFPAANNFLQKKWNDRAYKLHREKVKSTKTKLDTTKPKECPHLHLNLKKIQMEEEKQALIDRDNRILLSKLTNVLRSDGSLDNWNYEFDTRPRTLHAPHMQREQERIAKENERIMKRLNNASGTYNFQKLEDDYLMHEYYKSMKSQETKTYELQARGFEDDEVPHLKKSPREEGEHDEEGATAAAPAEGDDKLPVMETRPPPPRRLLKRHSTKLPLLGAERRKEEEKKKKEAISKPSRYDEKEDAAKLFKAIKGMLKAEPILIQVLARRTYAQRQQTISKFNQQYELDLEEDFTSQLDGDYHDFVSALLARREEVDAMALNHALKGSGSLAETFIEILCTRNNIALGVIKATYHRLYGIELEEDIKSEVKGQLRHLFLALIKGSRNEKMAAKSDVVETDASELMDDEPDRWTVNGGKLGELLSVASFDHIRAVLQEYDKVTDWELGQELKRTLSGDYKDAMLAMVKCLNNCASFLADQIHQVLTGEADESALIRIMITRSEVDLLQIRRAYRKKYNEPLIDALETKCRSPIKKALIQMVLVHGAPREEYETEKNDSDKQTVLPRVTPAPEAKGKPLRGPQPNKDATLPADNPLVRSTKWHPKSPVRRVVTPRGMNKAPSSRTSGSSKSNNRKPLTKTKVATPKSSGATSRQPIKPIPTKKLPTTSQTQSKSPTKSPPKSSTQSVKQKQTVVTNAQKPKSSESSRTKSSKTVANLERTKQDDNVKDESLENKEVDDETKKQDSSPEPEASTKPSSAKSKSKTDDEVVSSEQAPTGKDNDEPSISSENQISDVKDSVEEAKEETNDGKKDDNNNDNKDEVEVDGKRTGDDDEDEKDDVKEESKEDTNVEVSDEGEMLVEKEEANINEGSSEVAGEKVDQKEETPEDQKEVKPEDQKEQTSEDQKEEVPEDQKEEMQEDQKEPSEDQKEETPDNQKEETQEDQKEETSEDQKTETPKVAANGEVGQETTKVEE